MVLTQDIRSSSRSTRRPRAYSPAPFVQPTTTEQRRQLVQQRRRAQERANQPAQLGSFEVDEEQWVASESASCCHALASPNISGDLIPVQHARLPWARQPLMPHATHCHSLGIMSDVCPCCQAMHWPSEASSRLPPGTFSPFATHCKFGRVNLQPFPQAPAMLNHLLTACGPSMLPICVAPYLQVLISR